MKSITPAADVYPVAEKRSSPSLHLRQKKTNLSSYRCYLLKIDIRRAFYFQLYILLTSTGNEQAYPSHCNSQNL